MIDFKFDLQRFAFSGGDGSENNPYLISNQADLEQLSKNVKGGNQYRGKYFKVTNDISISGNFRPIDKNGQGFYATFDGDGHTISDLKITGYDDISLFGYNSGTIQNLKIANFNISGDSDVGALVSVNKGTINNVTLENVNISGDRHVGGLAGSNYSTGKITNSTVNGIISGSWDKKETSVSFGGLVGYNSGIVNNNTLNVKVSGNERVGGVAGENRGTVSNNMVISETKGNQEVGALVGNNNGTIKDNKSYNRFSYLTGDNSGTVKNNVRYWKITLPEGVTVTGQPDTISDGTNTYYAGKLILAIAGDPDDKYINGAIYNNDGTYTYTVKGSRTVEIVDRLKIGNMLFDRTTYDYPVADVEDLKYLATYVNSGNECGDFTFKLTADLDLKDINNWKPIGENTYSFKGIFNGNGHTISNLKITGNNSNVGLFGYNGGRIQNVTLTDFNVSGKDRVGGLAGYNFGAIRDNTLKGTVSGKSNVGAIVGYSHTLVSNNTFYSTNKDGLGSESKGIIENNTWIQLYNLTLPEGVTCDETVTLDGKSYITAGDATFTYNGNTYKYAVTGDVTVTLKDNKFFANDTDLGSAVPATFDGKGSENKPYLIKTEADLRQLATYVNYGNDCAGLNFKLANDIKLTENFTPIGNGSKKFSGNFDGDGHTISDLTINNRKDDQGLFGTLENATIKNFRLTGVNVTGGSFVGSLVGTVTGNSQILNCSAQGNVESANTLAYAGGLVGRIRSDGSNSVIDGCSFGGTVKATKSSNTFSRSHGGGIIGMNDGTVKNSLFIGGTIDGVKAGAIAGLNNRRLIDNYYYGTLADSVDPDRATRVCKIAVPGNVTSIAIVTVNGTKYVKAGNAAFNYNSKTYYCTVTEDLAVSVEGDNLSFDKLDTAENFLSTLDGDGSKNNPYLIRTEKQFNQLANYVNYGNDCAGKNFKLANDIALTKNFTAIGDNSNPFKGNFDGDGKTISNLTINGDTYQGLFGKVNGATIKNVKLTDVNISGKTRVGALVASADNNSQILNCSASGNIKSNGLCSYGGGLVGYLDNGGTIDGCTFSGNLEGIKAPDRFFILGSHVGGIVGVCSGGTIKNCAYLGGTIESSDGGAITARTMKCENFSNNYYYGKLDEDIGDNGATQIFKADIPEGVTSTSIVEINGTKYIKAGYVTFTYNGQNYSRNVNADLTVTIQDDKLSFGDEQATAAQRLKLYASDKGDTLTGGAGNDSLWGGAGKDTFIHNGGHDIIYGFGKGDTLKVNGVDDIIATYNAADNDIKIPCGTGSVTLKDFTTNEFPINNDTWTLSGNTITKQ